VSPAATLRRALTSSAATDREHRAASFRARAADVALTVAVAATSLALLAHGGLGLPTPHTHELDLTRTLLAVATAVPLLGWRRWPLGGFIVVGLASIVLAARGDIIWPPVGLAAALYLFASQRGAIAPWTPVSKLIMAGVLLAYPALGTAGVGALIHSVVAFAAAWFAGERIRLRRVQLGELRDRADRVEQAAMRERELAVAEERTRIARDLHDSAAHALNVIGVRAGAARLRHDPDRDLAALTAIEDLARQTMADIDHFVGTLRNTHASEGPVEVPPGLAALQSLLAQHRASGHRIELTRGGEEHRLAVPVDHGAYRILQEALTNAARYGTGATYVELTYKTDALELTVSNVVKAAPAVTPASGGHGLIGMHERAASLGGELTAQAQGARFRVAARLPYSGRAR
jgi:signal transduction histidine kinase